MLALLADHNIEGHLHLLLRLLTADEWWTIWTELAIGIESFASLGIPVDISDAELWRLCQERQIVLITGNRNQDGPESLAFTIQMSSQPTSLPVFTIGEPQRIFSSATYARSVAERLLEYLIDIDNLRGTRRLYLP